MQRNLRLTRKLIWIMLTSRSKKYQPDPESRASPQKGAIPMFYEEEELYEQTASAHTSGMFCGIVLTLLSEMALLVAFWVFRIAWSRL
jgi:hypothetical protein